jgi:hypothetical protein
MKTTTAQKKPIKPILLNQSTEKILLSIYFYRYMTALDVAHLLFSPSSLTHVRSILSELAGGGDYITHQYLYRFPLPTAATGNRERVYTIGSLGRDFLSSEAGLPVNWYFRPNKLRFLSRGQVVHSLLLTRFLVAAHRWGKTQSDFKLSRTRISYSLASAPGKVSVPKQGSSVTKQAKITVIPDAWLLFEKLKHGAHEHWFPVLLEIDRGKEYRDKFKDHVRSRIEFIRSGEYKKMFGFDSVTIAYATTGERPEFRETRRLAMISWTQEVLAELNVQQWASIFRFHSLSLENIYNTPLFQVPVWYTPDSSKPISILPSTS